MTTRPGPGEPRAHRAARLVSVAVCQVRVDIGDPDGNLRRATSAVARAVEAGAQLVVLPELLRGGYVFRDRSEALAAAEPATGPTGQLLRQLSADSGLVLVAGFCEEPESGLMPYNSAALFDHGQLVATYRKTHLWDTEKLIFGAGDDPPPVVQTSVGRVAVMICYDLEFPELMRSVAVRGAQLIAVPANWPLVSRPPGERAIEIVKAQAQAAVNRVAVAVADRCGTERGVEWVGGSLICDVDGYPVAGPASGEETVLVASIDLVAADDKSLGERNDVVADRRPELYGSTSHSSPPARDAGWLTSRAGP